MASAKLAVAKLTSSKKVGTTLSTSKSEHLRDIDRGYGALVRRMYSLENTPVIEVGVHEEDGAKPHEGDDYSGPVTIIDVATWNEFGTETIPERSFIRAWFDIHEKGARELVRRLLEAVLEGKRQLSDIPEVLGTTFVGQIQKRISAGIAPENAPATIAKKGSSKPLIDKGQLRSSITYKATKRNTRRAG